MTRLRQWSAVSASVVPGMNIMWGLAGRGVKLRGAMSSLVNTRRGWVSISAWMHCDEGMLGDL